MELYFERGGGNCRIAAINNCFGGKHITQKQFEDFYREYRGNSDTKTDFEFDYVHADWARESLLSFILWRIFHLTTFTIGQFEIEKLRKHGVIRSLLDVMDTELNRFFVANTSHVFCVRNVEGKWVCIDEGVHATTLEQWEKDPSLTLVFPWTLRRCKQGVGDMQRLIRQRFPNATTERIARAIIQDLTKREPDLFGDSQNWIALFYKYLKLSFPNENRALSRYKKYAIGSPLDIENALQHLPEVILFIIKFSG